MEKYRTVDIDGEIVTLDRQSAKRVVRAVELFVTVNDMPTGPMDFPYVEKFQKEQVALLLSLETGYSESVLAGSVEIGYRIYTGEGLTWTRWLYNPSDPDRTIPM